MIGVRPKVTTFHDGSPSRSCSSLTGYKQKYTNLHHQHSFLTSPDRHSIYTQTATCHIRRGVVAQRQVRCLASRGSQVRIPLQPPHRDPGEVLHSKLNVALWRVNSHMLSMP